jgi:hypothetical protein
MLKGTDLKIGMRVIISGLTKKGKKLFSKGFIAQSAQKPMLVILIEYPYIIFEFEEDQYKHINPFQHEKVSTKKSTVAMCVKYMKFKEVSIEYVNLLKEYGEHKEGDNSWLTSENGQS